MGLPVVPGTPSFCVTPPQTAFGTVTFGLVPPLPLGGNYQPYGLTTGQLPNWWSYGLYAHITDVIVTCSTTANLQYLFRPLNWTTFKTAVAKNTTAITLTDDPGVYSTNYRYPLPGVNWNPPGTANASGPCVADAAISSTNKYVAYQLADGTWRLDTITSGTFGGANLTLTTGTPNVTGATIAAGSPLFYFGAVGSTVPATGLVHPNIAPIISTQKVNLLAGWGGNASNVGGGGGASSGNGFPALFAGDPLVVVNANATATTNLEVILGDYRRF